MSDVTVSNLKAARFSQICDARCSEDVEEELSEYFGDRAPESDDVFEDRPMNANFGAGAGKFVLSGFTKPCPANE